jgi:hypothetical protein
MWPMINKEDLLQTKMMLQLLKARGRNPPPEFAAADIEAMALGLHTEGLQSDYLHAHVMMMNGTTTAGEYGRLVDWDDDPNTFNLLRMRK